MTKKQIVAEVKYWQKLLRLQDWEIEVKCIEAKEINDDEQLANVRMRFHSRKAIITIARDHEDKTILGSILHEMMHLSLFDLANVFGDVRKLLTEPAGGLCEQSYSDQEERAVDSIVGALLELRMEISQSKPFPS